jgi:hypothetical protein
MKEILFAISALATISYFVKVLVGTNVPIPLLHKFEVSFANTYISSPAIAYQCYFWANFFGAF